jgi:hypothetical protein
VADPGDRRPERLGRRSQEAQRALAPRRVYVGGKEGEVALAPSFPAGGIEGDHLIFRWIEADTAYSISLHAWEPGAESLESLRAVVVSLPT